MTVLLDLSEIRLLGRNTDQILVDSPGYAYLPRDSDPVVGEQAVAQAKLHPTRINNRFWSELSTEPASQTHPKVRHTADLTWYHLKQIKNQIPDNRLLLLVPSSYSADTLNLLAGICQSLDLDIAGFANRAVANAIGLGEPRAALVELQHHQTLITFVEIKDGLVTKTGYEKLSALGLARMQEHWLHSLRRKFISSYRFDPMHSGDTEQQLFAQIHQKIHRDPDAPRRENLDANDSSEGASHESGMSYEFKVTHADQQFLEQVSEADLATPFLELMTEVRGKSQNLPIFLDSFFAGIPGARNDSSIKILSPESLFAGARAMLGQLPQSDGPVYLDSFDSTRTPTEPETRAAEVPSSALSAQVRNRPAYEATHILLGGHAYPAASYDLSKKGESLNLLPQKNGAGSHLIGKNGLLQLGSKASELYVNSKLAEEAQQLMAGDQVSLKNGSEVLTAITVGNTGNTGQAEGI